MNETHHEMILERILPIGVEEWSCPECGRRFLVQWPPAYKIVLLEPGDPNIRHNLNRKNDRDVTEEFRMLPWRKWMEKVDFDSMWGSAT